MLKMNHTSFYALNVTNYHYKGFLKTSLFETKFKLIAIMRSFWAV